MDKLRFWKRKTETATPEQAPPSTIERFNIRPRTDVVPSVSNDPNAAQLDRLQKRRDALTAELALAESAETETNKWSTEIALIDQAISETEADMAAEAPRGEPGSALPAVEVQNVLVETSAPVRVRFSIGSVPFAYAEEIDWAERGFQLSRSELQRESGDVRALVSENIPAGQQDALVAHLERSLFQLASAFRDAALAETPLPRATLADLARPSAEYGGWLDWNGDSIVAQTSAQERAALRAELERLTTERNSLADDRAKQAEQIPIIRRRLREVEAEIARLTEQ